MATVTVPGGGGSQITYTFSTGAGLTVAQQIANALAAASTASSLSVTTVSGGAIPAAGVGGVQELLLTGAPTSSVPAGYSYVVENLSGAASITAPASTAILASTGGGVYTATGTGNVLLDLGAATGATTVTATGTGGTIVGGTATDTMSISGSNEAIYLNGTDVATVTSASDTIYGSANPMTISAGTYLVAGSGAITYLSTSSGVTTAQGGSTSSSINAPSGGLVYNAGSAPSTTINAGTASVTVFGASSGQSFYVGGTTGKNFVVAGSGNETLNASLSGASNWESANTSVTAGSYSFVGGTGNDTLIAGSAAGSFTLTGGGGGGTDAFVFFKQAAGGAKDVVTDFNTADSIYIEGYGPGSAAALQLQADATSGSSGVTLTLSDKTTITFSNLTSAAQLDGKIQYG